ncbi:hypothetical protein [Paenibacillus sinopodophylli]|uniref:hypothetical protein n=1 Tax=Paenibacillus sinopodophylli TaxID=1837342 RepID=UPI001486D3B6|nr:hypothetical protein [Paenibacillus sinopodophylli]
MGNDQMPRHRKPEGTRAKDQVKPIFLNVPNEVYELLSKLGDPHKVAFDILMKNLPK